MATAAISDPQANRTAIAGVSLPVAPPAAPGPRLVRRPTEPAAAKPAAFLSDALLENHHLENSKKSKLLDLLVVILLHVAFIGGPILAGLYFTDTLNLQAYYKTMIVGPPPPPPPPPAPAIAAAKVPPKRVFINQGKLLAPTYIPQQVANIKEAPVEPDGFGVEGGVPGGVPGGQMGGVIGGIVAANANMNAPLPPSSSGPKVPIRVGGKVRAPKGLYTPAPNYPVIARQTKIQGTVVIDAVLDEDGRVIEARIVSGHPLLIQAALDTVKEWRYEPSYLNNQPISVALIVNVSFVLQQ
jgi:protein TonB